MLLKCSCQNSSADMLYGKGFRPHSKLQPRKKVLAAEYICRYCWWVRTRTTGEKSK